MFSNPNKLFHENKNKKLGMYNDNTRPYDWQANLVLIVIIFIFFIIIILSIWFKIDCIIYIL